MDASLIQALASALGIAIEELVRALQGEQIELRRAGTPDATTPMHEARRKAMRFVDDPPDTDPAPSKRESYND